MGYAPFWPLSLATINVLIVPAGPISTQRFDEVYESLESVKSVALGDVDLSGIRRDLFFTTEAGGNSILFNLSRESRQSYLSRYPFELNSGPQLVLGVNESNKDDIEQVHEVKRSLSEVLSDLTSQFDQSDHPCTCLLLNLGDSSHAGGRILDLISGDEPAIRRILSKAATHLVKDVVNATDQLTQRRLNSPTNGRHSGEAGQPHNDDGTRHTSLQNGSDGQPASSEPSQIVVQSTDQQKARFTVILGLSNLLVGSWSDAMRRLAEGAGSAGDAGDRLWQARAIEGLLVCMTLQAWKGLDFIVPEVFDPLKAYAASQPSTRSRSFSISASITALAQRSDVSKLKPFQRWFQLAPFVANLCLDLYLSVSDRDLPKMILIEARLRLVNTLVFCQTSKGEESTFDDFVMDSRHPQLSSFAFPIRTQDTSLANMLLDIVELAEESGSAIDTVEVMSAASGAIAAINSSRKNSLLLRTLLLRLAPAMIEARKIGASEAGIHPTAFMAATTISATSSHVHGLRGLLEAASSSCGITNPEYDQSSPVLTSARVDRDLQSWTEQHESGDVGLKLEVLQACIAVCNAVPDFQTALAFMSSLLRLSIRSHTISNFVTNSKPWLTPEDQTLYTENIKKTSNSAERSGIGHSKALYWDNFLVRDMQQYQLPNTSQLTSHHPNELSMIQDTNENGPKDPFIFNPFAKTASASATPIVVAGELVTVSVLLQNSLEVEIDITDISLLSEGCDFQPTHHSMVLGRFCAQLYTMTGVAKTSGSLKIVGCRATIDGCYEQDFPIYRSDWQPPVQVKQKPKTAKEIDDAGHTKSEIAPPFASILYFKVINPQPEIELSSSDLSEASIMLLEGEQRSFQLSIKNASTSVPADLVLFSFQDSVSDSLQEMMKNKDLLPVEMHEVQYQLRNRPVLRAAGSDGDINLAPQMVIKREFRMTGRPGLTTSAVQVNFAFLGKPHAEVTETFHTRHARFPILVTVNGSIEVIRCAIYPVGEDFVWPRSRTDRDHQQQNDGFCLVSLDLRNVWPRPMTAALYAGIEGVDQTESGFEETIQPGQVCRAILPVSRVFVQDVYAPVPSLVTQRQFVVSASKLSLEAEAASREGFWYREALLKRLRGTWTENKTGRHGEIDLRKGIRMTPRMIDSLKVEHVDISFEVTPDDGDGTTQIASIEKMGPFQYSVPVECFATVCIRVQNRSQDQLSLLVRLQPSLRGQPHNIALDLSRRLAWSGALQRALYPPLEPGDVREVKLGIVPFAAGHYEINATVEEIKGRKRIALPLSDGLIGNGPERRIWHARSPCLIDVPER